MDYNITFNYVYTYICHYHNIFEIISELFTEKNIKQQQQTTTKQTKKKYTKILKHDLYNVGLYFMIYNYMNFKSTYLFIIII